MRLSPFAPLKFKRKFKEWTHDDKDESSNGELEAGKR